MALMGYNIPFPDELVDTKTNIVKSRTFARERAESLLQVRDIAPRCNERALADMKSFADRYRREAPILKAGDKVFLSLEHLTTKRNSKKIDYLWDGRYEVSEAAGTHTYRVKIPTGSGKPPHNVFHISRLRKVDSPGGNPEDDENMKHKRMVRTFAQPKPFLTTIHPEDDEYEVEKIVGSRKRRSNIEYLVRWTGYNEQEEQWEPERHLTKSMELIH